MTDRVSWRWCFYINLPIGAVTAAFVLFFFHAPNSVKRRPELRKLLSELDPIGSFFFLPAIVCLLLALQWGGTQYSWKSPRIIVLFVLTGVLLLAFVAVQIRQNEKATLPPRIVQNRNIWSSAWFAITLNGAYFVFIYYVCRVYNSSVIAQANFLASHMVPGNKGGLGHEIRCYESTEHHRSCCRLYYIRYARHYLRLLQPRHDYVLGHIIHRGWSTQYPQDRLREWRMDRIPDSNGTGGRSRNATAVHGGAECATRRRRSHWYGRDNICADLGRCNLYFCGSKYLPEPVCSYYALGRSLGECSHSSLGWHDHIAEVSSS